MKKRVFVTGMSGFVGSSIAEELRRRGFDVIGSRSRTSANSDIDGAVAIKLGDDVDPKVFSGCSAIVHCAHSLAPNSLRLNVDGTRLIAEAARRAGVQQQIFISSYTALSDATTEYAKAKRLLEQDFDCIIRPGLVIGRGGLFQRLSETIQRSPIVPLMGSGRDRVPVVWSDDLAGAVAEIIEHSRTGVWNLFNTEKPTMLELLKAIRLRARSRALLIPVPIRLLLLLTKTCEALRIRLPVSSESVLGYVSNSKVETESHLPSLIYQPLSVEKMMERLFATRADEGSPARV